ncbi:MAG TPA: hypothetical protein VIK78_05045 [Ruminiclostridium sp.]
MEKRYLYLEKISAQIEQYNAKITGIRGKANEVQVDMKLEYLNQVEKFEGKIDDLKEKYEQLRKASESSWQDIKEGTENALNELKESFANATERFK